MKDKIFGYLEGGAPSDMKLSGKLARHEEWTEAILPADAERLGAESETNRRPLIVFAVIIFGAIGLLGVRLFGLQIIGGDHNLALADGNRTRQQVTRAPRGDISDRNGVVLASNQASFDVTVIPQQLPSDVAARGALYSRVATTLGMSAADVQAKAEVTCKGLKLSSGCLTSPVPQLIAANVERNRALMIDQDSESLPGFSLDTNPIRQYTDEGLLSVSLGYTGRVNAAEAASDPSYGPTDLIGKLGLEKQYESVLRGKNGYKQTEVDATGKPVRVLASQDPSPGSNLVLAIDMGLQRQLAQAITKQMVASGAKRASGVAINPKTGEVLAAVSLPSYDNNLFGGGISTADYQRLVNDPGQPLFNKFASGTYPSGSIIKPIGAAGALEAGIVTIATTVLDAGQITIPNKYDPTKPSIYKGWETDHGGLGVMTVLTALARSSDIFFYKVMGGLTGTNEDFTRPLGVTKLTDYYKLFGLGARTGIDLPNEAVGRVPTPAWKKALTGEGWFSGDTYNISVGQGDLLVSPLQMAASLAAIANGGTLYQPHLLNAITDSSGNVTQTIAPTIIRQNFISKGNMDIVRQGMWMAVNDPNGTACCRIKQEVPVEVAGKTGTAETVVHDDGSGALLQSRPHAWFEAFAPFNDPKIAIVVLVEHAGEGAEYAAPAVRETLSWYFTQGAGSK